MNVYDFDNTLYDGESGVHMFLFYLKKKPRFIRYAPQVFKGVLDYKRHKLTLTEALARYEDIFHEFLASIADFEADAKEFWDKYEHRLRPIYAQLRRPDDLVISASPEHSLKEICSRMGISRYIGTRINEETDTFEFICFRENKVKAFREQYPCDEIDDFYTDSMNDKPLMELAKRVFFVGKKGQLTQMK
ncbi:MAG: HAD-IB family phosphatase [Oscillospiraceae bacterium]|nr:HAD-IB family phosphatase [Oscillospiraceae bacterium]